MLKDTFIALAEKFNKDGKLILTLWKEIEKSYTGSNRYYHTLHHLDNVWIQLSEVKSEIKNPVAVLFALFYHDIVYNVANGDNEEKSAELAAKNLAGLHVPGFMIDSCCNIIIATKKHLLSEDNDINFFTDADLSVLGTGWKDYAVYAQQIRNEYSIYPDPIYTAGREKVLQHFLSMKRIFKTGYFFKKFEENAKQNLEKELEQLK